jgi:Rps23 Pro-64 3,4-dihydroxylase Tpa1-like proline 4-hydroxylase
VIDTFLPSSLLDEVLGEFPRPNDSRSWTDLSRERGPQVKKSLQEDWRMGPITCQLIRELNSATFLDFLELLTGDSRLVSDPFLEGGGLHQIQQGGRLAIHADFSLHPRLHLDRRLNVLLYLNRQWDDVWGGHLELWNDDASRCVKRYAPIFNRFVVFSTTDRSYHGHPDALQCPSEVVRRSIALYYYSKGRPQSERSRRHVSTHWRARPGEAVPYEYPRWHDRVPTIIRMAKRRFKK